MSLSETMRLFRRSKYIMELLRGEVIMSELCIPAVEVESAHGIREVSLRTRHLMDRRIFLTGQIDAALADAFLSQILYVEQTESEPVTVYINNPGGEVNSGLMIYDAIADSSLTVNTVCTGLAASMAAIILAGGKRGHRYILKHSTVIIITHDMEVANECNRVIEICDGNIV